MPTFNKEEFVRAHNASGRRKGPLWAGPCGEGSQGGITFSLLSKFLVCRERFRIHALEGLQLSDRWNHRLGYGEMWHLCEEALASGVTIYDPLTEYSREQYQRYPLQQEEIRKWNAVCCVQFPYYADYWSRHPDVIARTPVSQEQVFDVRYNLPSGRAVRLRGKFDSVDVIKDEDGEIAIYLQENKTKGDINEWLMQNQLQSGFDLQTMLYMTALTHDTGVEGLEKEKSSYPIRGIRYNVVRRPLSGGRGTIRLNKGETEDHFYRRLGDIIAGEPEHYFMRWKVRVTPKEIERFRRECLDPILEQLCWWYDIVTDNPETSLLSRTAGPKTAHWRHPYGIHNPLNEGGMTDLDNYLLTGQEGGLQRTKNLFPELQSA